jgi:hypothetical protein
MRGRISWKMYYSCQSVTWRVECCKTLDTYSVAFGRKKRFDMRSHKDSPEKDAANNLTATLAVAVLKFSSLIDAAVLLTGSRCAFFTEDVLELRYCLSKASSRAEMVNLSAFLSTGSSSACRREDADPEDEDMSSAF